MADITNWQDRYAEDYALYRRLHKLGPDEPVYFYQLFCNYTDSTFVERIVWAVEKADWQEASILCQALMISHQIPGSVVAEIAAVGLEYRAMSQRIYDIRNSALTGVDWQIAMNSLKNQRQRIMRSAQDVLDAYFTARREAQNV